MSIPYKKETFYTTFQAFTGSLEGEIQIKERIE
jgi:DNA polymerase/3'-5' exonuclease PolX